MKTTYDQFVSKLSKEQRAQFDKDYQEQLAFEKHLEEALKKEGKTSWQEIKHRLKISATAR